MNDCSQSWSMWLNHDHHHEQVAKSVINARGRGYSGICFRDIAQVSEANLARLRGNFLRRQLGR